MHINTDRHVRSRTPISPCMTIAREFFLGEGLTLPFPLRPLTFPSFAVSLLSLSPLLSVPQIVLKGLKSDGSSLSGARSGARPQTHFDAFTALKTHLMATSFSGSCTKSPTFRGGIKPLILLKYGLDPLMNQKSPSLPLISFLITVCFPSSYSFSFPVFFSWDFSPKFS